jgi:hypothetical protein
LHLQIVVVMKHSSSEAGCQRSSNLFQSQASYEELADIHGSWQRWHNTWLEGFKCGFVEHTNLGVHSLFVMLALHWQCERRKHLLWLCPQLDWRMRYRTAKHLHSKSDRHDCEST